jgi:RHS repeat-associated protein
MSLGRRLRRLMKRKEAVAKRKRKVFFEAMEPRLLLSGDSVAQGGLGQIPDPLLDGSTGLMQGAPSETPTPVVEMESNDTPETASLLSLTEDPAGSGYFVGRGLGQQDPAASNSNWSDPDCWRIEALAGDVVSVSVETPESGLDPYVEVMNAANSTLAYDDNWGPGNDAFISHYEISSSGTYYVVVGKSFYGSSGPGSYELRVDLARGIQLESDAGYGNDFISGADALTLTTGGTRKTATVAGTVMGSESSNADEDLFSLGDLNTGNVVELSTRLPSTSSWNGVLTVVNASEVAVADTDGSVLDGHFLGTVPSDGAYYAKMLPQWVYNGHTYLLTGSSLTWSQAEAYAQALGGHLVTINDSAENEWVRTTFSGLFGGLWIGLNDSVQEGNWVWSSGQGVAYTNWSSGEPNNYDNYWGGSDADGAFLATDGKWADVRVNYIYNRGLIELDGSGTGGSGSGSYAQYLLDVAITDLVPPRVTNVAGLPANGAATDDPISSFTVSLSEAMEAATVNAGNRMVWSYAGHFYTLTQSSVSWTAAETVAQALGGHIVRVDDAGEQQWLTETFGRFGSSWIGFTDQATEGAWEWISGDGAATYTNWASGQPYSGTSYNWAYMESGGQWRSAYGTNTCQGIIELTGADADGDLIPDVVDPYPADPHPADPHNAFDLREAGVDRSFDTADDEIYQLTMPAAYATGMNVSLFIEGGPLDNGHYRFTANATLKDQASNALDGNRDGTGGDAFRWEFDVLLPAGFVFEGGNNDTAATATLLPLTEDPAGSRLFVGRGLGKQDWDYYNTNWQEEYWRVDGRFHDPDFWQIEALAGDVVSVSVDTPEYGLYPYVEVRNAANSTLAYDENAGPGSDAFISHFVIPSSGAYYVVVAKSYYSPPGSYELRVDLARGIQLEADASYSNDSISGANALTLTTAGTRKTATVAGTVMGPDGSHADEDLFSLGDLNTGNVVELSTRLPSTSSWNGVLTVVNGSGVAVADTDGSVLDGHFLGTVPADGVYYAKMLPRWGYNGHTYLATDSLLTWSQAEAYAQGIGGHLVTINDSAENEWVRTTFSSLSVLWIGLNDSVQEGKWVWPSGQAASYTNWASGEPNNSDNNWGGSDADGAWLSNFEGKWMDLRVNYGTTYGLIEFEAPGTGVSGPGPWAQYLLEVTIADIAPDSDLVVSAGTTSGSAAIGETINLSWSVTNQGTGPAVTDWYDSIYLSSDATLDSSGRSLGSWSIAGETPLAVGSSYSKNVSVTIPVDVGLGGSRYLLFVADRSNAQAETSETNNLQAVPITITVPDLVVSAGATPSSTVFGETINLSWSVTNQGTCPAVADWYDSIYLSSDATLGGRDQELTYRWIASETPLAVGASYSKNVSVTIPADVGLGGSRYLLFVADRSNAQAETSETNNLQAVPITITAPDLVADSVVVPAAARFGQAIDVGFAVRNAGNAAATAGWSDLIWLSTDAILGNDTLLGTQAAGPLGPGEGYTRTASVALPLSVSVTDGTYFILVQTDASDTQAESSEANNIRAGAAMQLTLPPLPDLAVSGIVAPVEALSGQQIPISWTVKNQGSGAASGTWTDRLFLSADAAAGGDQFFGSFSFTGTIPAGESVTRTQTITLPNAVSGDRWVIVKTDAANQVFEHANETNNTAVDDQAIAVRLSPYPNLQVTGVTPPATAFSSQENLVEWQVANTGTGPTSAPFWYDAVYLSPDPLLDATDVFLGQSTNASYLDIGESYRNSMTVRLPRGIDGNFFFLVKADASNQVFELDSEGDNIGASGPMRVQLTPPPDLQVASVQAPSQAFSGQSMTLNWSVANEGTGPTFEAAWYDQIYMSADEALDGSDRLLVQVYHAGVLKPGESYAASRVVTLPMSVSGDFFFLARTDGLNHVYEHAFEGNNVGHDATPTHVNLTPPPDLEVEEVTAPATALAGHPLTIAYRVTNFGATVTPNPLWIDSFYLSTDATLDPATDLFLGDRTHSGALGVDHHYDNQVTFTLPNGLSGTFYAFVYTDRPNAVFEMDNANNINASAGVISIESRPADLVIEAASAPGSGEAGRSVRVDWTVRNAGTGDTVVSAWTDRVIASADAVLGGGDDLTLLSIDRNELLNAGDSYARSELVNIPFNLVGRYSLFVVSDVKNNVYEGTKEGNNVSPTLPITITRQTPDLQVTAVSTPGSAAGGMSMPVNWTVENLGSNRTNSNYWYDTVYLSKDLFISGDDREIGTTRRSNSLDTTESYNQDATFTIPADLAGGTYYAIVRTDTYNHVLEDPLEQNNDRASNPISITPAVRLTPNLVLASVAAPDEAISGQAFSLTWTVGNDGAPTGSRTWYDAVYISRDQVFDRGSDIYAGYRYHNGGLATGEVYSATQTFTVPNGLAGPFYLFVAADSGGNIQENSELDNAGYDGAAMLVTLAAPADLVVGTITIPANAVPGLNATLSYSVRNQGENTAFGTWFDSIYISADEQWDVGDALFGRLQHTGDVPAGTSYSGSLTAPLPGVTPGEYNVIIRSDILNRIPESNENNNIGASLDEVSIDAQALVLGAPVTGRLGQSQSIYYRVDLKAGETLLVSLDSAAADANNELYIRYGEMPTRAEFDFSFSTPFVPDQEVVVPATRAGTYYILAYGSSVPGAPAGYTVEADLLQFSIRSVTPDHGSNVGQVTMTLEGVKFSADGVVSLVAPDGTEHAASRVWWVDSSTIWATFDLRGLALGTYDVEILDDGLAAVAQDVFMVNSGKPGDVDVSVAIPSALRPGQVGTVTVEYANAGETDVIAPLLFIASENALLRFPGETGFSESGVEILGINQEGPAGILPPGAGGIVSLIFKPLISTGTVTTSVAAVSTSDTPVDWSSLKDDSRPAYIPADGWNAIWTNFTASVGNTFGEFVAELSDNANRLSQLGNYTNDIGELLAFELQQADDFLPGATLASALDVAAPAPGLPLTFARTCLTSLSDRSRLGPLGRGWTHQWEISAGTDSDGNVLIQMGDGLRSFFRQADGSYVGSPSESAALSFDSGTYRLREADGTVLTFRSDGRLNCVEDPNGNRISALYTDSKLTRLLHSNGDSITLSYNAQGRIRQLTDPAGDITTYAYDTSGEHLLSVTGTWGTILYTYDLGQGTAREHALHSIEYPGGTHRYFEYDDRGRLFTEQRDGGAGWISYSYDSAGGVSITNAAGDTATMLLNNLGQVGQFQDALGRSTRVGYDTKGNRVLLAVPRDLEYSYAFDDQGNVIRQVDPLGNSIGFTYDPMFNRLLSVTDARGNVTRYGYDDRGNPSRITYPDESFRKASYDPVGNILESVNARGQAIHYTYDDRGLVKRKGYVDGSHVDFTYDGHGNMRTATDASGTTTMEYDSRNLLKLITYPSGRFIRFTYDDGGRRTQMSDQDGFTVNYHYDAAGRLERLTDSQDATVASYTYDLAGRLGQKILGNGTYTTYEYDAAGQLLHLVNHAPDGSVNSRFDYTYDELGRCTSMATMNDGNWIYTYDAIGRLTNAEWSDPLVSGSSRAFTYVYDAAGNRIRTIERSGSGLTETTTEYTTNNMNQYTMVGGVTYKYDADGNLVSKIDGADVWTYGYDDGNRLTQVTTPEGLWTYDYDVFGNRIATVSGGQRIEYLLDPAGLGNVVGEYDGSGNVLANYTYGLGLTSRKAATGQEFYYDFDALGSTIGLTGSAGSYLNSYSYLPFGESFRSTEQIANPFGYVGEWGVATEGNDLHFMRARYYDSAMGRFFNMDPIGVLGGDTNLYSYVDNDPVNWVDPFGLYLTTSQQIQVSIASSIGSTVGFVIGSLYGMPTVGSMAGGALTGALVTIFMEGSTWHDVGNNFISGGISGIFGSSFGGLLEGTLMPGMRAAMLTGIASGLMDVLLIGTDPVFKPQGRDYTTQVIQPIDPNDIIGLQGFGEEHWLPASQTLPYTINFENAADATAPAQQVVITQQLDPDLDPRTFRVDDFGWGGLLFELPGNQPFYHQRLDLRQDYGFFVDVSATIDVQTGLATWNLTTIDPATGEQPLDANVGFLPPDNGKGSGEGFVSYSVRPRRTVATGDVIDAQARIIFDTEEPIDTPPIFNTLDATAPTSAVNALPGTAGTTEFLVTWTGNDDEGGSAVGDFTIYVSDNGSVFLPWLSNNNRTEATFTGQSGHSYGFYSIARDNAGNMESAPNTPDAHVTVLGTGRIEGGSFEDIDGDSMRDEGEPGLSGWTIYLDVNNNSILDDGERSTVTDTDGAYAFPNLFPGTYFVTEVVPAGWVQTAPTEAIYNVAITGGSNITGIDFGNQSTNDPPINTVPATQETDEDTVLVFSSGNSNAIIVTDEDAGSNPVQVTLAATNGLLTLGGTLGLTFSAGDGTADGTVSFTGTLADINAALESLQFVPVVNFNGEATLELITNDLGNTGAGGPKIDTDSLVITVLPVNDAPVADAGSDTIVNEGNLITRSGLYTDPDKSETCTFLWEVLDTTGNLITTDSDQTIQFTPVDDDGQPYTASFTVTDSGGAFDQATFVIAVNNIAPLVDAGSDASIDEGSNFASTGSFTDRGTDTWTASVDYGDDTGVQPLTLNPDKSFDFLHVYADDGSYTVTVSVEDDDAGAGSDSLTVTVSNVAPTADTGGPYSMSEGNALVLDGSGNDPSPLDTANLTFSWDLNNDGTFGDVTGATPTVSWAELETLGLNDDGEYTIALRVLDDNAFTDAISTLTINNVSPTASITGAQVSSPEGTVVTLDSLVSDPGTQDTLTYAWLVTKDGNAYASGSAHAFAFTPDDGARYDVSLTVTDDDDGVGRDATTIDVTNVAPALVLSGDSAVAEGAPYTLNLASNDPGADTISGWTITWGDGIVETVSGNSSSMTHVYAEGPNVYTISATATDEDGAYDASNTVDVNVTNVVADLQNLAVTALINENDIATLSGNILDPGTQDSFTLVVDWGDGLAVQTFSYAAGTTSFNETHKYLDDNSSGTGSGTYAITATLADNDNGSDTATGNIAVNNVAAVVSDLSATTIDENGTTTLMGKITDPGTLDTFTLDVNWGDLLSPNNDEQYTFAAGTTNFDLKHQYLDDNPSGTPSDKYTINLTLTDDDAGVGTGATTVAVNNAVPVITHLVGSASDIGDATERELVSITGAFADVGKLDTHTATIDWGDGTISKAGITEKDGSGLLSGSHKYGSVGIYEVKVNLSDDDSGSIKHSTRSVIMGVGVKDGVLYVIGTHGDDHVSIDRESQEFKVQADFLPESGHFRTNDTDGIERIEIYLGDGNDHARIAGSIDLPVLMDGGAGDDNLTGGYGNDVLEGGPGEDTVLGNAGEDTIVWRAGDGSDAKVDGGSGLNTLQLFGSEGADIINVPAGPPAAGWSQPIMGNPVEGWQYVSNPSRLLAEDFTLRNSAPVTGLRWWGGGSNATQFDVYLYSNSNRNLPDNTTRQYLGRLAATWTDEGQKNTWGQRVCRYDVTLPTPLNLTAGATYWLSIVDPGYAWQWQDAGNAGYRPALDGVNYAVAASGPGANDWNSSWDQVKHNLAFEVLQAQGLEVTVNGTAFIAENIQTLQAWAGGGNDRVSVGNQTGNVTAPVKVDLGAGDDILDGSGATTPIIAYGGSGDDTLFGGSGADTLEGGPGADTVLGNAGDDTIVWRAGDGTDAKVDGGSGLNTLQLFGSEGDETIADFLQGQGLGVTVNGTAFVAENIQTLQVWAGGGNDTVIVGDLSGIVTAAITVDLGAGDDILDGSGGMTPIIAYGGSGHDTLTGGSGADRLEGGYGNDVLTGGPGADTVLGNAGDDTIVWRVGDGSDAKVDGGSGLNTLQLFGSEGDDTIDVQPSLPAAGWAQPITGGSQVNGWQSVSNPSRLLAEDFSLGNSAPVMGLRWWGGGSDATQFDVYLYSNGSKNLPDYQTRQHLGRLTATRTDTGQNNDWGQRVYRYDVTLSTPLVLTAGATYWLSVVAPDYAWQWQDAGAPGYAPAIAGVKYAVAASDPGANDWNSSWDDVKHNLAFEVVQAKGLKVKANGASIVAENIQSLQVFAGAGDDTVIAGDLAGGITGLVSVDLGDGNDTLNAATAKTSVVATGGNGNDTLMGGSAADIFDGGEGNDVLKGGSGNDLLIGGSGADSLYGEGGSDVLVGTPGRDVLDGGSGTNRIVSSPPYGSEIDPAVTGTGAVRPDRSVVITLMPVGPVPMPYDAKPWLMDFVLNAGITIDPNKGIEVKI